LCPRANFSTAFTPTLEGVTTKEKNGCLIIKDRSWGPHKQARE
jgi:hypothetical protein